MTDIPFHVAGGAFTAQRRQTPDWPQLLASDAAAASHGSRRRKLWEIPHKFHCPVIGVCFGVDELRALMARVMHFPGDATDFVLHTTAVSNCETRTRLASLLHKQLEQRYQLTVRRFAASKDGDSLRQLWREAVRAGNEVPGALWAGWTHPACDKALEQEIYSDIHMLQHQVGSGTRADLATLKALQAENGQLRQQLAAARREVDTQRDEKSQETRRLGERIAELRVELAGKDASLASLTGQLDTLRDSLPELKDRLALARRANDAEARATALRARTAELESDVEHLHQLADHAEQTIRQLLAAGSEPAAMPAVDCLKPALSGKCVLCVGGRSGAIDAYRQIVEQRGGRFLHHDGGLEESLHRIDAALSAADLVICQAGCISHNAYWRVKEQCKRTGKQCVFIKNAGVSSFGRVLSTACTTDEAASE